MTISLAASYRSIPPLRAKWKLHVPDPQSLRDSFIAATALVHGMTVVTRNVADFVASGVNIINPWTWEA
jgi:predicted nucleic acid-binding protein